MYTLGVKQLWLHLWQIPKMCQPGILLTLSWNVVFGMSTIGKVYLVYITKPHSVEV